MKQVVLQLKNDISEENLPKLKLISKNTSTFGKHKKTIELDYPVD